MRRYSSNKRHGSIGMCHVQIETTYVVELTCRTPLCMVSMGAFAPFPGKAFPAMLDEIYSINPEARATRSRLAARRVGR
jgi:hypothetical protein